VYAGRSPITDKLTAGVRLVIRWLRSSGRAIIVLRPSWARPRALANSSSCPRVLFAIHGINLHEEGAKLKRLMHSTLN
jgi:hypothetical protein